MVSVSVPASTRQISYRDLYARWERGNWSATSIDFSQDKIDWQEKMTEQQRRSALWLYSLFFHGEDSVADNLSPYIDAAPLEEQKYFLTTQQVDEARHSVFFQRFMEEVAGVGDGTAAGAMRATADQLSWGHRKVFARLDEMADELRRDRSKRKLAAAVTLYHIVVEASLAQPGQHMIERYLTEYDLLPGFREGMANVALDEQRHIGFGVKLLADLCEEDPRCADAIVETIREVLPWTSVVPLPPNRDRSYTECFGFTLEDLFEEGARSQEARLRAIGLPVDDLPRFPLPMDLSPRERGERGLALIEAGLVGPKDVPVRPEPRAVAILFDTIRRQADASKVPPGTVVQWDFADAEPWYLRCDDGATAVHRGRAPKADVTLKARFEDFADVTAQRADPRWLMLRGRIRAKGNPRLLLKLPKLFA
ncbi:MAG TPA: ribonucleotide-diphosphate reductase subunit beta [Capillimicrobium sp.]|nr:ribonucleotide-diphosphate reductase subunit beta [Capillimicrobium sp.]